MLPAAIKRRGAIQRQPIHFEAASLAMEPRMKIMTVELTHEDGTDFANWSTFGETLPAEAFDRLLRVLVETRRTMEPAFPEKLPMLVKEPPQVDSTSWQWTMQADGHLILNTRHPGLGWIGFRMPDVEAFHANLSDVLAQRKALREEIDPPVHRAP
jgi:hypothetical protein